MKKVFSLLIKVLGFFLPCGAKRLLLGFAFPGEADRVHPMDRLRVGGAKPEMPIVVGLLTGGYDRHYTLGLASTLAAQGIFMDVVGSDALDAPELHNPPLINFLNLRGDRSENVGLGRKIARLLNYYGALLCYAAVSRPPIFHILWNNKFEPIDRVVLMLYYKLLGKRIVVTAHNVNVAKRDGRDSLLNRLTLRFQYWMSDHIFVHTERG
jgi:hypothetical protein